MPSHLGFSRRRAGRGPSSPSSSTAAENAGATPARRCSPASGDSGEERQQRVDAIVSPSAASRLEAAERMLLDSPPDAERIIVAPSRDAADDFVRHVACRRGALLGVHRASFVELVVKLASPLIASRGLTIATALGLDAIASRTIASALAEGELQYLAPIANLPGFRRSLLATLRDLRLAGTSSDGLARAARTGPDLARLASRYDAELSVARVADLACLLLLAREAVNLGHALVHRRTILLLDVPLQAALERDFVAALTRVAKRCAVTVAEGDTRTRAFLDALGDVTWRNEEAPSSTARAIGLAQACLFQVRDVGIHRIECTADEGVELFSAPGEGREAVEIARRVLREAARGVAFDRMAIFLRAPGVYAGLLESALSRARVPAWFSRGTRRPDPSGRAFLSLLACVREGLSASRFAEYLSLGQVPSMEKREVPWVPADDEAAGAAGSVPEEGDEHGEDRADEEARDSRPEPRERVPETTSRVPWKWERLLNEAAVIGGADRWRRRLDGLAREIEIGIEELASDDPDAPRAGALRRDLEDLARLREFALPTIELLASWPGAASWGDWLDRLEDLAPRVLASPARVLTVLAALRPIATLGPVSVSEVHEVLLDRLRDLQQPSRDTRFGRVLVGTPDTARGRQFDVVFVPGLAERVFPGRSRQDPLLADRARQEIDPRLPIDRDRLADERLRLRLAVGAARQRLYVSYASLELASSRDRVPSFYALDLVRAIEGTIPDHEKLARRAARASGARLAWPAPSDPDVAIDAIEHDLASLRRLLQEPYPARRKGRARYLLQVNPVLARALRARYTRWRRAWSAADGLVLDETARPMLAGWRLRARPYSASALQRFAACPYQFYLASILRLRPRTVAMPVHRMDPLTRGRLVHETIAACTRQLLAQGGLPRDEADVPPAFAVLDAVLDGVAGHFRDQLAPAVERIWDDEIAGIRSDLRGWLATVAESGGSWTPAFVELGFGFAPGSGRDPASRAEPVTLEGGWQLHGIVDLVERRRGAPGLRVTDYKTGRHPVPFNTIVGHGAMLQPVFYGLAIQEMLGEPVLESRLSYCTSAGRYAERVVPLTPDVSDARRAGREVLEVIDRAVELGFLPPAPRHGACEHCDFIAVCGPGEERRLGRKDERAIGDLELLRRMR